MEERFYAEYYEFEDRHWWFLGRRAIVLSLLAAHLPPENGVRRRILDVGTGTGAMLGPLGRFGDTEGIDAEEEAVRACRRRGAANVRHYDGTTIPVDDGTFDVVTVLDVIEHVEDHIALVAEVRRVTRPGGKVMVTVPAFRFLWGPQDEISHHHRRYVRPELRSVLERAGLEIERLSYFNTFLFPPIAAVRLLRRAPASPATARSDFGIGASRTRLNRLLTRVFAGEAALLRHMDMPVGVSLVGVARRP
jgi:2-polyprenyl-3-methyl-5-hydroxy-6-metoxy-1,4-benzoquinol methylase